MRTAAIFLAIFLLTLPACLGMESDSENESEPAATTGTSDKQSDSETITIPLDQVWAIRMPGTRDLEKLGSDTGGLLVYEVRRAIGFPPRDKEAERAYAVSGTGLDALREAHAVFVDKKNRQETFTAGSDVSVVFFAHETHPYVHLQKIERQGSKVRIYYRFVPHETEEMTRYVALIPLGKLPNGKYQVNVIRSPMEQKYVDMGFQPMGDAVARRIVCRSFSFSVTQQGE